jgi:uncharacterized repeat protein (TIGR03803 family)
VFKLDPTGRETVLYTFLGSPDGSSPFAGVSRDSAGNLYGTTHSGGITTGVCAQFAGCGVVFKLDATGKETILHTFTGGTADGAAPYGGVIGDSAGNLYGTTFGGGASGLGIVYKLNASGNLTVLHTFTGGRDGAQPYAGRLIRDSGGYLYGTTWGRGASQNGVVYKLHP